VEASALGAVLYRTVGQGFSPGAQEAILLGIIGKGAGQKGAATALGVAFARLPTLLPRSIEVHAAVRGGLYRSVIGVVAIRHHLLGMASQGLLAALQGGRQLAVIDALGDRLHIHNQPVPGVGEQLHVVAGDRAPLAISHHVRFRVRTGGAGHKTVGILLFLALQSLHLLHRSLQPALALPCSAPPRYHLPLVHLLFLRRLFLHQANLLPRQGQVSFQLLLAPERVASGIRLDFRAVQRHPLQRDQAFGTQHPQHLHE
jgi:hypothetical protein